MLKAILIMAAMAALGLVPVLQSASANDTEFSVDNSIRINDNCEHDCTYKGDIKQEGSIDYSESHDEDSVTDVLVVNGEDLKGHKVTFTVDNLDTGAHLDKTVSDYDEYYAKFSWYDGFFPIGTSYQACIEDHKTEDVTCKTKSHQSNPDEITIKND